MLDMRSNKVWDEEARVAADKDNKTNGDGSLGAAEEVQAATDERRDKAVTKDQTKRL